MEKKILHIFPDSMFISDFMKFLDTYFNHICHDFIITDIGGGGIGTEIPDVYLKKYNVVKISTFSPQNMLAMNSLLKKSDIYGNIIFHSLYLNYLLPALLLNMKVVRRSTLSLWGGQDIGPFIVPSTKRKYKLFGWFYEKLRRLIIPEFKYIGAIVKEDYEKVKLLYDVKGIYKVCKYLTKSYSDYDRTKIHNEAGYINIQVGHSGSALNYTLEVFDELLRYKESKIRIYCPLSYGDEIYINEVINKGKTLFGKKFIPMTKQMAFDNFSKFVSNMDIYISNCTEQGGLGNLTAHLVSGNKIYLNGEGVVFGNYTREHGYHIYKITDISKMTEEEFTYFEAEKCAANTEKIKQLFDKTELVDSWVHILVNDKP